MLGLIFTILMIVVFGKLALLAFKMTWGITKIFFTIIFLPVILIGMVFSGLISIALPLLVILGIVAFLSGSLDM